MTGGGPFDIQHSLDYVSIPFEALMARLKARHYIYNQSNMNEHGSKALLRVKMRLADRIIAISDSTMKLLSEYGASSSKLRKVYLGIDTRDVDRQVQINKAQNGLSILSVGRIIRRKRHEDAIKALSILSRTMPQLTLRIAGNIHDQQYHQELQNLVNDLGLSGRVDFLGLREDVLEVMKESSALLHCAESEGFGWVVVEAMAVGLPVIASAVDGPRDILDHGKTGLLVPTGDISGYADALKRIFSEPGFSRKLTENARASVEMEFSAEKMVEKIANVYREFVAH